MLSGKMQLGILQLTAVCLDHHVTDNINMCIERYCRVRNDTAQTCGKLLLFCATCNRDPGCYHNMQIKCSKLIDDFRKPLTKMVKENKPLLTEQEITVAI